MKTLVQIAGIILLACTCGCNTPENVDSLIEQIPAEIAGESRSQVSLDVARTLYFQGESPDAIPKIEPGIYQISQSGDSAIQFKPQEGAPLIVNAQQGVHEENIDGSLVLAEEIGDDEVHIVILLPDGKSLDTVATYSGIAERGLSMAKPALSRQRLALAGMSYSKNRRGKAKTQLPKYVSSSTASGNTPQVEPARQAKVVLQVGRQRKRPVPVIKEVQAPGTAASGSMVAVTVQAYDRYGLNGVVLSLGNKVYRHRSGGKRTVNFTAQLAISGTRPAILSVQAINTANLVSKVHRSTINVITRQAKQPGDTSTEVESGTPPPSDTSTEAASGTTPPGDTSTEVESGTPPPTEGSAVNVPTNFDLRDRYPQNPVPKNQGPCGSCYLVAPVAVAEWAFVIDQQSRGGQSPPIALSAQAVMDCGEGSLGSFTCNGGWPKDAYDYLEDNGVPLESEYPYAAQKGTCQEYTPYVRLTGSYTARTPEPNDIKSSIYQGRPVTFTMDVYQDFYSYNGGVYRHETGSYSGKSSMVAIGWGNDGGIEYWIVANTWGSNWGDNGYFKIAVDDESLKDMWAFYYGGITIN